MFQNYWCDRGTFGILPISVSDSSFCTLHMLLRLVEGLLKRTAMAVSENLPPRASINTRLGNKKESDGTNPRKIIKINTTAVVCDYCW